MQPDGVEPPYDAPEQEEDTEADPQGATRFHPRTFWAGLLRGGDLETALTQDQAAWNYRKIIEAGKIALPDGASIDEYAERLAGKALQHPELHALFRLCLDVASGYLADEKGLPDSSISDLALTVSRTDTPVAMCSPAYDSIRFDSGLYGAISRSAKIYEALSMIDLRDERAHADLGRIERLYWLTARWHGFINVDFLMDWPAYGPLSDAKIFHWGTIAFFMLHEIGHAIQHLEGFDLTPFDSELGADSLALTMLKQLGAISDERVAVDFNLDTMDTSRANAEDVDKITEWLTINLSVLREPAFLCGVVELATFVMRRDDEARFLEPPHTYPRWCVRREKLLASLAASYPSSQMRTRFDELHRTVELARPCYRSVPLDSLEALFRRNQQMLVKTSDENFRHADLLEDFDELFHAPAYRLLQMLALDNHPNQNSLSSEEAQEIIDKMDEVVRKIVASMPSNIAASTDPKQLHEQGIPFRYFYDPQLPPLIYAACARYRAIDLGLVPREAIW